MSSDDDLGFSFHARGAAEVTILRAGKVVTVLRGRMALDFMGEMASLDLGGRQQAMARVTGNYKRGNESRAAQHPRNRPVRNT
jgi:hypothetical protein